jgi:uncharacterized protein (TIGR01370 family)
LLVSLVLALAATTAACARPAVTGSDLARVTRWWILIGSSPALEGADWRHHARDTQMVVLAGDPRIPADAFPKAVIRLGYLSVGEADVHRSYWQAVSGQPFLVEPNPNWPGNLLVDLRDERWRRILLSQEIPHLVALGFDGLFLDTIDTPAYLEGRNPARFAGSRHALQDLLREIRAQFPKLLLVANGTTALAEAAPYVAGYVVEGMFATYDFGRRAYRPTTADEQAWKQAQIDRAQAVARRPVFTIEYADIGDVQLARAAAAASASRGFHPYVATKELNTLP